MSDNESTEGIELNETEYKALDALRQSEANGKAWAKSRHVATYASKLTPMDVGHTLAELEERGLVVDWTGDATPSTWGLTDRGREVLANVD